MSLLQVAQLSEYLPLQYPIEKVLSILDLSTSEELNYASMVITRDYRQLRTLSRRTRSTLQDHSSSIVDHFAEDEWKTSSDRLTRSIFHIPPGL